MKYLFILLQSLNMISCRGYKSETVITDEEKMRIFADSAAFADSLVAEALVPEETQAVEENPEIKPERIGTKKDSILSNEKRTIHGNTYYFRKYYDEGWRTGLKIVLHKDNDSSIVYDGDDSYRGGNCNITSVLASDYEVHRDTLIIFTLDEVKEHMNETNPHYSSGAKKETYAIQKKGTIVRLKTEYGKNDTALKTLIEEKLQEKLNQQYGRD